jgi:hypothetical protein
MSAQAAAAARKEAAGGADNDDVDMEVEDVDMDMGSPEPLPAPLEPIQPSQVIVRDYDPKRMLMPVRGFRSLFPAPCAARLPCLSRC